VLILTYEGEKLLPGSGANTVNNLAALGAEVYPVGLIGEDEIGCQLEEALTALQVDTRGLSSPDGWTTTSKTRIMAGDIDTRKQQVVRIDRAHRREVPLEAREEILGHLDEINEEVDAWVVSDYGYGLFDESTREKVCSFARDRIVVIDSRFDLARFKGATAVTPNEVEAAAAAGRPCSESFSLLQGRPAADEEEVVEVGKQLLRELACESVLITRGNKGMMLFEGEDEVESIPIAGPSDIVDVTGAGDTVASTFTLGLVAGATMSQAAHLANFAASVVVMKMGVATVSVKELVEVLENELG
jgi:rfaE bifunctional protein kinase chain/domain